MAKKILFINQEIFPYVSESEMSVMGKALPQLLQEKGSDIRTFMPKWGNINERRGQLHEVIRLSGMNLIINETDHPLIIKVASIPQTRIQVLSSRMMTTLWNGWWSRRRTELTLKKTEIVLSSLLVVCC